MSAWLWILIGYFIINFILGMLLLFWFKGDEGYGKKAALKIFVATFFIGIPMLIIGGIQEVR